MLDDRRLLTRVPRLTRDMAHWELARAVASIGAVQIAARS
jgi:hypothetical protein